jgi:hypothetical protein
VKNVKNAESRGLKCINCKDGIISVMIADAQTRVVEFPEGVSKALARAALQAGISEEEYIIRAITNDVEKAKQAEDE